jgi:hypothetical protein
MQELQDIHTQQSEFEVAQVTTIVHSSHGRTDSRSVDIANSISFRPSVAYLHRTPVIERIA